MRNSHPRDVRAGPSHQPGHLKGWHTCSRGQDPGAVGSSPGPWCDCQGRGSACLAELQGSRAFQDRTEGGGQHPGLHVARGPILTLQGAEVGGGGVGGALQENRGGEGSPGHLLSPLQRQRCRGKQLFCFVASENSGECHAQTVRLLDIPWWVRQGTEAEAGVGVGDTANSHVTLASGSWHKAVMETLAF